MADRTFLIQSKVLAMATKQARGTKRTCQSNECGARFYDLDRTPIVCPVCGSIYELPSGPVAAAAATAEEKAPRRPKKPEYVAEKVLPVEETAAVEGEEVLADVEEVEEQIAAEEDETFLEQEEEEGGDVSNIIGGPVQEGGEETRWRRRRAPGGAWPRQQRPPQGTPPAQTVLR